MAQHTHTQTISIKQVFTENLRRLRKEKNLTQAKIAKRIGSNFTTYSVIELGKVWPTFRTIQKLAKAFGVSEIDLFTPSNNRNMSELDEFDKAVLNVFRSLNKKS